LNVNNNIGNLRAQSALAFSHTRLQASLERLSTGIRVNRAEDDASGLVLRDRFQAQRAGLEEAVRNIQTASGMVQVAEEGLNRITDALQQVRQLAVRASDDNLTDKDRSDIQEQVKSLLNEINDRAEKTRYNGHRLLDGSISGAVEEKRSLVEVKTNAFLRDGSRLFDIGLAHATGTTTFGAVCQGSYEIRLVYSDTRRQDPTPTSHARYGDFGDATGILDDDAPLFQQVDVDATYMDRTGTTHTVTVRLEKTGEGGPCADTWTYTVDPSETQIPAFAGGGSSIRSGGTGDIVFNGGIVSSGGTPALVINDGTAPGQQIELDFTSLRVVTGEPHEGNEFSFTFAGKSAVSADGRYVVYYSGADNLVRNDTNGMMDIFVRDTASGATKRLSLSSSGVEGNDQSLLPAVSSDGRYVVFSSLANNLVADDTNGVMDVFLRDTVTNTTTRLSVSSSGGEGDGGSDSPNISGDGRYVVFSSTADNLVADDTNGASDIFMRDTLTGTTSRLSVDSADAQANGASYYAAVSADGRYVVYHSDADNLVANDTNGASDVFMRDTLAGTTTRLSVDSTGIEGNSYSYEPTISADGRYVAYSSYADNLDLVTPDLNFSSDVFLHDNVTGATTRLSLDSTGVEGDYGSYGAVISADGTKAAFFSDADNLDLVTPDTNFSADVFTHDLATGTTERLSLDSSGIEGNNYSDMPSVSSDGRYVVFESAADNLVPDDTNGTWDVFVRDTATGTTTRLSVSTNPPFVGSSADGAPFGSGPPQVDAVVYWTDGGSAPSLIRTLYNVSGGAVGFETGGARITVNTVSQYDMGLAGYAKALTYVSATAQDSALQFQTGSDEGEVFRTGIEKMTVEWLFRSDHYQGEDILDSISLASSLQAQDLIGQIDDALRIVGRANLKVGAFRNEFDRTLEAQRANHTQITSGFALINDADMAMEATHQSRRTILLQSATAMIAQANTSSQYVLQLLR